MNYILNNDTETMKKLNAVFLDMAKKAKIQIDGAKAAEFLKTLIQAFVGNSIFIMGKDSTRETIVCYQFKVNASTIRVMRSVFAEVLDRKGIRVGFLTRALFLKRLVEALIEHGVFVKAEEDDGNEVEG